MFSSKYTLLLFLVSTCFFSCRELRKENSKKITDRIQHFVQVKNWPEFPEDFKLGNPTGLGIDSSQNIFIFHRADREWPLTGPMPDTKISSRTILMLDKNNGKILNSWGDSLFIMPHGLTVDHNNNIWVTDVALHQVFKFSHEGELLLQLGEPKKPGDDSLHFNLPTDVAVAKDGSFYVSDGYGNSRIVKFSPDGNYLFEWGKIGVNKAEFNIPHGIDVDKNGNVYVADRENCRLQIFDSTGKFLRLWENKNSGRVFSVAVDNLKNNFVVVDDVTSKLDLSHQGSDIFIFNSSGKVSAQFGRSGAYDGPKCWYHDVAIDKEGNIYVGDILGNRVQKFSRQ